MCTSLCGCMHVLMDARRGWQNFRSSVTGCSELPVMGAHVTHDWEQWSKVVKMRGARLPIPSTSWWPSWFIPTAIPQSQMMNGNDPQWAEPLDKQDKWELREYYLFWRCPTWSSSSSQFCEAMTLYSPITDKETGKNFNPCLKQWLLIKCPLNQMDQASLIVIYLKVNTEFYFLIREKISHYFFLIYILGV